VVFVELDKLFHVPDGRILKFVFEPRIEHSLPAVICKGEIE
jgi:hypothetical protein